MKTTLQSMSDTEIMEEAAKRLQSQFRKENGSSLLYGSFRFIFHDGRFQGIEDWPRNRRYQSPSRFVTSTKPTEEVG